MSRDLQKAAVAGGILLLVALSVFLIRHKRAEPAPIPAPAAAPVPEISEIELTGRLQARTTKQVAATVEGTIDKVFVDVDQEVYQGQMLAKIIDPKREQAEQDAKNRQDAIAARETSLNNDEIAARLEVSRAEANQSRARSELDRAQKAFERQKALWDAGATARIAYENAQKDYDLAKEDAGRMEAAAKQAQDRLKDVTRNLDELHKEGAKGAFGAVSLPANEVVAPADGVVISRKAQPGEKTDPSVMDLFEIATELTMLQAVIRPEATLLPRFQPGHMAIVKIPELTPEEFPGMVGEIRDGSVIVDFSSPAPIAKLNLAARVRIKF